MRRITLLFISIFILPIGLFSQVVADFSTVDKVAGCPPLFVHFTNASSGSGVLSYKWSIGNGVVVTQVNPSRTYIVPGKYDIKLVVTNGVESDSITKTEFLEVFNPPTTLFTPLDTLISCAPNDVQFTNLSLVGSSPIAMVRWDFGDGYVSSVPNPKHPYVVPGIYTPSLTLRDSNGCTSSLSINNQIKVYKPNALFSSGDHASCEGALTVPFTNLSEGNGTMRYLWDFGDGTFSTVKDSLHYFEGVGNYTVSLKVMDDKGCSDTITKVNYVVITSIIASFSMPTDTVCPGSAVQFTNTTLNSTTYSWDFGDGAKSTLQNPKHTYAKAGSYEVVLQTTNGLCGGIAKKQLWLNFSRPSLFPLVDMDVKCPIL